MRFGLYAGGFLGPFGGAFLAPLLLAAVAASSEEGAVGRTVGTFAAVQTTALVASPLIGGLAGEISWRLAFLAPAVAALALAGLPLPGAEAKPVVSRQARQWAQADPPRLRSALTRRVGWLSTAAFLGYLSIAGLGFLVAPSCGRASTRWPSKRCPATAPARPR